MSRSYRKPYWTETMNSPGTRKGRKRAANKSIRQEGRQAEDQGEDLATRHAGQFKRKWESWNINDYSFHDPKNKKVRRK